jgi:hypothetical protein
LRYTEGFQLFVSIDYQAISWFPSSDDENHTFRLLTTSYAYLKTSNKIERSSLISSVQSEEDQICLLSVSNYCFFFAPSTEAEKILKQHYGKWFYIIQVIVFQNP